MSWLRSVLRRFLGPRSGESFAGELERALAGASPVALSIRAIESANGNDDFNLGSASREATPEQWR